MLNYQFKICMPYSTLCFEDFKGHLFIIPKHFIIDKHRQSLDNIEQYLNNLPVSAVKAPHNIVCVSVKLLCNGKRY